MGSCIKCGTGQLQKRRNGWKVCRRHGKTKSIYYQDNTDMPYEQFRLNLEKALGQENAG